MGREMSWLKVGDKVDTWMGKGTGTVIANETDGTSKIDVDLSCKNDQVTVGKARRIEELRGECKRLRAYLFDLGATFRLCKVCGREFVVARGLSRKDRRYCQQACRFKAYRERKSGRAMDNESNHNPTT